MSRFTRCAQVGPYTLGMHALAGRPPRLLVAPDAAQGRAFSSRVAAAAPAIGEQAALLRSSWSAGERDGAARSSLLVARSRQVWRWLRPQPWVLRATRRLLHLVQGGGGSGGGGSDGASGRDAGFLVGVLLRDFASAAGGGVSWRQASACIDAQLQLLDEPGRPLRVVLVGATEAEAAVWRTLAASADLAHHIPVVYSIACSSAISGEGEASYDIRMQDLVAGMTRPCAMALILGSRTLTPADLVAAADAPRLDLLDAMVAIDPDAPTAGEREAGVSRRRFLAFLDERSSTSTLGFRIDAGKTVTGGTLGTLPLPAGCSSLATLRGEDGVVAAISSFLQHDAQLAAAFCRKLESLAAALERSNLFSRVSLPFA